MVTSSHSDNDRPPVVSVIMAVRNCEQFLPEAIGSIIQQSERDWELIAVDDGSDDRSAAIVEEFARSDPRVRPVGLGAPVGVSAARNKAIELARGRLLAVMDADDVSLPDRFAREIEFLDSHPDHVGVGCEAEIIDPGGRVIGLKGHPTDPATIERSLLAVREAVTHPSVMFRGSAIRQLGGYRSPFSAADDFDLLLRLSEVGRLANLPEVLFQYRFHLGSISVGRMEAQVRCALQAVIEAHQRRGLALPPEFDDRSEDFVLASVVDGHVWRAQLLSGHEGGALSHRLLDIADEYCRSHRSSRGMRSRLWVERSRLYRTQGAPAKGLIAWIRARVLALWPRLSSA
jgi:glycosyltransferase involved in cell wall biosynthesis